MNNQPAKVRTASLLIIVLAIGFSTGFVSARGTFPALERVIADHGTIISDMREAAEEVNQKKANAPEDKRNQVDHTYRDMMEAIERQKEAQDEWKKMHDLLESLFGSDSNNNTSGAPSRRKP